MNENFKMKIRLDDFLLVRQKPYSRSMAWIEIVQEAYINGGKLTTPERTLALRWEQTRHWVRTLIDHLEKLGLITVEKDNKFQVIKVLDIEGYFSHSTNSQPIVNQSSTNMHTENQLVKQCVQPIVNQSSTNQRKEEISPLTIPFIEEKEKIKEKENTNINVCLKENEISAAKAALSKRKEKFYSSLVPYVEKYKKEMIREFFDFWTEMNKSETKMRFELERTWEVGKRLATWARRSGMMPKSRNNMSAGVVWHKTSDDYYEETKKNLW